MGLNDIAFFKNPLLISTFNTFILVKWLRMFRFTKLDSIISFANLSWWSHNSACNVALIVLSPQLKLILKYFYFIILSHEFFMKLIYLQKRTHLYFKNICSFSFCGIKKLFFKWKLSDSTLCVFLNNVLPW